jgi:hypothetical protein
MRKMLVAVLFVAACGAGPTGARGPTGATGPNVNAFYTLSSTIQVPLTLNTFTVVPYSDAAFDTNVPVLFQPSTSSYAITVAGLYSITASIETASHVFASNDYLELAVVIGTAPPDPLLGIAYSPGGNETLFVQGTTQIKFSAGQTFTIKAMAGETGVTLANASNANYVAIARIGD